MSAIFNRTTFYCDLCFMKEHALKSSQLITTQNTVVVNHPIIFLVLKIVS